MMYRKNRPHRREARAAEADLRRQARAKRDAGEQLAVLSARGCVSGKEVRRLLRERA